MKGLCHDILYHYNLLFGADIFAEILIRTLYQFVELYEHIFPSRIRNYQMKCDVTYIIAYIRSFRNIVPENFKREINQICIKLAAIMSIMNIPAKDLAKFLWTFGNQTQ
jgi:hypothetical protein